MREIPDYGKRRPVRLGKRPSQPADVQPVVLARDGKVFASSKDVAAFFGKQHSDVLKAIRNLISKEPSLGQLNFASFKISDLTGESTSHYDMDRDGFMLLAMGFRGSKALAWKLKYIDAFNKMEAELRGAAPAEPTFAVPQTLKEALLLAAAQLEKIETGKTRRLVEISDPANLRNPTPPRHRY